MNAVFKTRNNNHYLFNPKKDKVVFLHPLIYHFFKREGEGINLQEWISNLKGSDIDVPGIGIFTKKEIVYYFKKFIFFKENEYFKGYRGGRPFQRRLNKNEIENLVTGCKEIIFEVTKACNLDCHYCIQGDFYEIHDTGQKVNIDLKKAKLMLTYLEKYWSRSSSQEQIGIKFYGGEPLLNMKAVKEIVDYSKTLKSIKDRFYYYITTNGVLLDRYLDYLVANDFRISISLDGDKKNSSYRVFKDGRPAFEKIIRSINKIRDKHPEYFKNYVSFQAVLHDRNSITELDEYFEKAFQKQPVILELTRSGVKKERREDFDKIHTGSYNNLYYGKDYSLLRKKKLNELPKTPDIGVGGVIVHNIYNWLIKGTGTSVENSTPTGTCHPFSKRIFLSTDGKILPCERIEHKYAPGHIEDKVILDFQAIADTFNNYYNNMIGLCGSCSNSRTCKKCMFYCNAEKSKPVCNHYSDQNDFLQRISENICYMEDHPEVYYKHLTEI